MNSELSELNHICLVQSMLPSWDPQVFMVRSLFFYREREIPGNPPKASELCRLNNPVSEVILLQADGKPRGAIPAQCRNIQVNE